MLVSPPLASSPRRLRALAGCLAAMLAPAPGAGAAEPQHSPPATVSLRLLPPDASGEVRGALAIDLEPGWKTYWVAPGPVGLAPDLQFGRSEGLGPVAIDYPVPIRFSEGANESAGYDAPTAFALRSTARGGVPPVLRVDLVIGVCRDLCVPLGASLEARPDGGLSARAAVAAAFAALPDETPAGAAPAARLSADGREIAVTTAVPRSDGAPASLFVSGPAGWTFGTPETRADPAHPGALAFSVPVERRPEPRPAPLRVDLLLTSGQTAQLSRSLPVALP